MISTQDSSLSPLRRCSQTRLNPLFQYLLSCLLHDHIERAGDNPTLSLLMCLSGHESEPLQGEVGTETPISFLQCESPDHEEVVRDLGCGICGNSSKQGKPNPGHSNKWTSRVLQQVVPQHCWTQLLACVSHCMALLHPRRGLRIWGLNKLPLASGIKGVSLLGRGIHTF